MKEYRVKRVFSCEYDHFAPFHLRPRRHQLQPPGGPDVGRRVLLHQLQGLDVYSDLSEEQLEILFFSGSILGQYGNDVLQRGRWSGFAFLGESVVHGETDESVAAILLAVAVAGASQDEEDLVAGTESFSPVLYVDHSKRVFYRHLLLAFSLARAESKDVSCVTHNASPCSECLLMFQHSSACTAGSALRI